MAWSPPGAGDLRQRVRFERLVTLPDTYGEATEWQTVAITAAKITPSKGGEEVRSARMSGIAPMDVVVRSDSVTRTITSADRLIDLTTNQVLNIKWAGCLDERNRFIMIATEAGGHVDV